jgi:hypothetical protein
LEERLTVEERYGFTTMGNDTAIFLLCGIDMRTDAGEYLHAGIRKV